MYDKNYLFFFAFSSWFPYIYTMSYNEQQLIEQLQSGQSESFWPLYDTYFKVIYNHIYYKTLNQSLTEDVVSDTFFKAFDKIHQFAYTTENSFRSRLYTIANNTLLDSYKKITPDQLDETFEYESDENITSSENNRYISEQILTELDKLSPSKKDLVVMRIREWLSYEEISAITGRSPISLRKDFSVAIKDLKIVCAELWTLLFLLIITVL